MMGDYKIPSLTTDIFIFDENTDFILIKRKNDLKIIGLFQEAL